MNEYVCGGARACECVHVHAALQSAATPTPPLPRKNLGKDSFPSFAPVRATDSDLTAAVPHRRAVWERVLSPPSEKKRAWPPPKRAWKKLGKVCVCVCVCVYVRACACVLRAPAERSRHPPSGRLYHVIRTRHTHTHTHTHTRTLATTRLTTPSFSARRTFCIFIASITHSSCARHARDAFAHVLRIFYTYFTHILHTFYTHIFAAVLRGARSAARSASS